MHFTFIFYLYRIDIICISLPSRSNHPLQLTLSLVDYANQPQLLSDSLCSLGRATLSVCRFLVILDLEG